MEQLAAYIPWIPALAAVLCGLCATKKSLRKAAAPICIGSIAIAFILSVLTYTGLEGKESVRLVLFQWIHAGGFGVDMAYLVDSLTIVMLFVVTGIGTLVAIYAAGYMAGDKGYARFFAYVALFIFAMTSLVLADNLVLLYLGWEGVGLCSYLLIGYYYDKPSAAAAAKKAFIVNRIGDLGFALGIFLTYTTFGTVSLTEAVAAAKTVEESTLAMQWIPFLLMLGAFGKSAQIPLYVWLPDAMEGPTPVSALIHAATMVTAGVYMIARLFPVFELSPYALPTVATIGGLTALFAATIALCQNDLKRVFAYSTVSQLGYMFLGVGVLTAYYGVFHLFTHAFFKALLFLTAGSVMHALAGQLDMKKMSGMRHKMPVTCWLMFIGCLALAGFPLTAGFFSKDKILAATFERGLGDHGHIWFIILALVGLFTAFLTAFYTFRLWFRVFMGPERYELGDEHHGHDDEHSHDDHGEDHSDIAVEHHHEPHEMSWLMNGPLVILALGALFAGLIWQGWVPEMVKASTAKAMHPHHIDHDTAHLIHWIMMGVSAVIAVGGIALAAYYHWLNRKAADRIAMRFKRVVNLLENKYWVDEIYDAAIVRPLRLLGEICFIIDRMIIDGLVTLAGFIPRLLGLAIQPSQRGQLQTYGLGMVLGLAVVAVLVVMAVVRHG